MSRLLIRLFVVVVALSACDRDDAAPLGRVSVALSADVCADYCLIALRASLYADGDDVLPIGPALQVGCGETLTFAALPAGERVRVVLQAFDITGEQLLDGSSEPITIIADGVAEARVKLVANAPPEVTSYGPDPIVVAAGAAELTLVGRFGAAFGRAGVTIGGQRYPADALTWTHSDTDEITMSLPNGARGGELVVEQCGVGSAPIELRVIGATMGEAAVTAGATCIGANARAAVAVDDGVLVAWGCADGSGVLTSFKLDDALCPLDPGASWSLATVPDALAVRGDTAWVGGAGLSSVVITSPGGTPTTVSREAVHALAATGNELFAIIGDVQAKRLVRLSEAGPSDVAGVDAGLTLVALAASPERVFVAAQTSTGEGRIISIPSSGVVAAYSLVDGALRCERPMALALAPDGLNAVIGCVGGKVAVWRTDLQRLSVIADVGQLESLTSDTRGDLFFGSDVGGASVAIIDIRSNQVVHRFARTARSIDRPALLVGLARNRLLMPTASASLAVLTPFDQAGPCAVSP